MTKFQVTLNLTFEAHRWEDDECLSDKKAMYKRERAYARTDEYYMNNYIIDYLKSNDAMEMVDYLLSDGEVLSAEWDKETFAIHMVVETDQTEEELREDLLNFSLEDGEYEACGDTGWILFTRDEEGKPLGPPWKMTDTWEYGLTDYRQNPILIEEIKDQTSNT